MKNCYGYDDFHDLFDNVYDVYDVLSSFWKNSFHGVYFCSFQSFSRYDSLDGQDLEQLILDADHETKNDVFDACDDHDDACDVRDEYESV